MRLLHGGGECRAGGRVAAASRPARRDAVAVMPSRSAAGESGLHAQPAARHAQAGPGVGLPRGAGHLPERTGAPGRHLLGLPLPADERQGPPLAGAAAAPAARARRLRLRRPVHHHRVAEARPAAARRTAGITKSPHTSTGEGGTAAMAMPPGHPSSGPLPRAPLPAPAQAPTRRARAWEPRRAAGASAARPAPRP